jgi:hypothetical protein
MNVAKRGLVWPNRSMGWRTVLLLGAGGVIAVACSDTRAKTAAGSLGNAKFGYLCTVPNDGDTYCDALANDQAFPEVALGAKFGIGVISSYIPHTDESYALESLEPDRLEIDPAMGVMFECSNGNFCNWGTPELAIAHATGWVAFFANETDTSNHGNDFLNVRVGAVAGLSLTQVTTGASGQVSGTIGPVSGTASFNDKQVFIRAFPVDAAGTQLAGALSTPYAWTTSSSASVAITSGGSANIVELALGSPGMSTLTVTMGTATSSVAVTVN